MLSQTGRALLLALEAIDQVRDKKSEQLREVWAKQIEAKNSQRPFFKLDHQISAMTKEVNQLQDSWELINQLRKNHESLLRIENKQQQ